MTQKNKSLIGWITVTICLASILLAAVKCRMPSETNRHLSEIVKAGGLDHLNAEVVKYFEKYGTNTTQLFVDEITLAEFPSISALGDSAMICGDAKGVPQYINLRSGNHWNYKIYMLFKPGVVPSPDLQPRLTQLSSNVYFLK